MEAAVPEPDLYGDFSALTTAQYESQPFRFPTFSERNPGLTYDDPVKRCDKKAADRFRALQRFQFPYVTSPDLC